MDDSLGRMLLDLNLVNREQLERAVTEQKTRKLPRLLGEILVEQGVLDEKTLRSIVSVQKHRFEATKTAPRVRETDLRARLRGAPPLELLKVTRELGASDLYLSSPLPPLVRLHGVLQELPADPLPFEECRKQLLSLLSPAQADEYAQRKSADVILDLPGAGRFRANVFRHLQGIGAVFRTVSDAPVPLETLGLPGTVRRFASLSRGLVLVTGPAGSGKSATLAGLVDLINRTQRVHVVTIEDPIEIVHASDKAFVSQRQVPGHSKSFSSALRSALREDPDVIVVGELRDPETVATAITAAETGHLIFGTLHTHTVHRTVLRLLDQFPPGKRAHIRALLASVLRGVVCQQLLPNLDGKGRSLATEVMTGHPAISNLIREDRAWQIPLVMQTHRKEGMRLMDDSLRELVQRKKVSYEEALLRATDRVRFARPEGAA